jgi:hypothetical protein
MFYSEDEVQPAVTHATMLFGRVGTIDPVAEHKNVCIATKQFGKLWYGDVTAQDLAINVPLLQASLGQEIFVLYNNNDFNFDIAKGT